MSGHSISYPGPSTGLCARLWLVLTHTLLSTANRINTVHTDDVAAASWAVAKWIAKVGREEGNKIAGEDIYFAIDKELVKDLKGEPGPKEKLVAPFFNIVRTLSGSVRRY